MQENDSYLNKVDSVVEGAMKDFASPIAPVHELIDEPIYQACIFVPYEETESIREQLPNSIIRQCETTCLDIIAKTGGKVKGIERFLEIEGILPEETIAFGDANNDIEMLNFCGISVAMGNGYEEVKEISDFVTTDIDEDGIWNAVKHFEDRFISEELEMEN